MLLIGHRGCGYPDQNQNTLRAFRKVIGQGVPAIEFDVQKTADDALVIVHNLDLTQVSTGRGLLSETSLEEIRRLWAGDPARGKDRIPVLEEVLSLLSSYPPSRRPVMHLELKGDGTGRPTGEIIRSWLDSDRLRAQDFLISSFNWEELRTLKAICPELKVALLQGAIRRKELLKKNRDVEQYFAELFAYGYEGYMIPRSKHMTENIELLERLCPQTEHREILQQEIENALSGVYYTNELLEAAQELNACSINLWHESVQSDFIRKAHDLGLKVFVFTVNREEDLSRMYQAGVDGLFTDFYLKTKELIEKLEHS